MAVDESVVVKTADEGDIIAIHAFMIRNAIVEMAEEDVDTLIYMQTIYDTVMRGAGLIALVDGQIVGYLGIWKSQYDYSKASFLHDRGFYVLPAHRNGAAGIALLKEARAIAEAAGFTLKIIDTNPTKVRRRAVTGQIIGFRPAGRIFTIPNKVA